MDLAQLSEFKAEQAKLDSKNLVRTQKLLDKAFDSLDRACVSQSTTEKKSLLGQSLALFERALYQQRLHPDIYVGLATFYLMFQDSEQALQNIQMLERLAPEHPDIETLKAALQPSESLSSAFFSDLYEDDIEQLQLQIQEALREGLRELLSFPELTFSDLNEQAIGLQHKLEQTHIQLARWRHALQRIEADSETQKLYQLFIPIEKQLKVQEQKISQFIEMKQILAQIQLLEQKVIRVLQQIHALPDSKDSEENALVLEEILELCDHIADQIDFFEGMGLPIHELEPPYHQLLRWIEALQDVLD